MFIYVTSPAGVLRVPSHYPSLIKLKIFGRIASQYPRTGHT